MMSSRGKKDCPECSKQCGARLRICECGFKFVPKEKPEPKKKEHLKSEEVDTHYDFPEYTEPKKLSPAEHARRILSYGKDRAALLLQTSKIHKCWSHIDWALIEQEVPKLSG